jgi:2-oxo-3-hexenedioate decarboxylase
MDATTITSIAIDLADRFGTATLPDRYTILHPGFDLDDAYQIATRLCEVRQARGEISVGRKIGATNRLMWPILGATGPFWGFMYDKTVFDLDQVGNVFDLGRFSEPRIEPEIVLRLGRVPRGGMSDADLLACVDAVAHGFELVHSPFAGWKFVAADATAAYGLHMALLHGPWHEISGNQEGWADLLTDLRVTLTGSDGTSRSGAGRDAFGSPLLALQSLVDDLEAHPERRPLKPGEIVTTGTLTEALPVKPGQTWTTVISNAPLAGISLTLT